MTQKIFVLAPGSGYRFAFGAMLVVALASACGSNRPEIPPELLEQPDGAGSGASYPAGPYGAEIASTAENFSFQGWRNPLQAEFDPARFETISFADYYNPAGTKATELLMVNTAATWCQACKVEHGSLPEHNAELSPRGLVILSTLFQDASNEPADQKDLVAWTQSFDSDYPMALDPEYQMGRYASAATAPLNLIIDARNMKILRSFLGDQAETMWPYIDGELAARGR